MMAEVEGKILIPFKEVRLIDTHHFLPLSQCILAPNFSSMQEGSFHITNISMRWTRDILKMVGGIKSILNMLD
jgi:hypothetical protein